MIVFTMLEISSRGKSTSHGELIYMGILLLGLQAEALTFREQRGVHLECSQRFDN